MAQLFGSLLKGPLVSRKGGKQFKNLNVKQSQEDLLVVKELLQAGQVVPVIDRRYTLGEVPQAFRYSGQGHAKGKVVITVEQNH
jgi:NADPH:quinone reductase-like Zn-dependent oxidoreductase